MPTIFLWDRFSSDICQNEYFCKFCIFTIAINSSRCKYQQFEVQKISFNLAVKFQFEYKIPDISYNRAFPLVPLVLVSGIYI